MCVYVSVACVNGCMCVNAGTCLCVSAHMCMTICICMHVSVYMCMCVEYICLLSAGGLSRQVLAHKSTVLERLTSHSS